MRTSLLVGLVVAAAAVAALPSVSATDLVCLNSGADCVSTQGSGTGTEVCVKSNTYGVAKTCEGGNLPTVVNDADKGICVKTKASPYDEYNYQCVGPDGINCYYYTGNAAYPNTTGCTVGIGTQNHLVCLFTTASGYFACIG